MLRFRNRFQHTPSDLHRCKCGGRMTVSEEPGRETVIHELPWCDAFATMIRDLQASDPSTRLHHAMVVGEADGIKTIVLADGDSVDDVSDPLRPPSN